MIGNILKKHKNTKHGNEKRKRRTQTLPGNEHRISNTETPQNLKNNKQATHRKTRNKQK